MSNSPTSEPLTSEPLTSEPLASEPLTAEPLTAASPTSGTVEVAVGRVLRAHGVRGRLVVLPLTDEPADRLTAGTVLTVEASTRPHAPGIAGPGGPGPAVATLPRRLTVVRAVADADRFLVRVEEISDRDTAEALRGSVLLTEVPAGRSPVDPEEFYDHQLVGLAAQDRAGERLGTVTGVDHRGAQDLLVVATPAGEDVLVPFVAALVPEVDVAAGRVVLTPPPGLFDDVETP